MFYDNEKGGIAKPKHTNIIGLFRRESSVSGGGPCGDSDSSVTHSGNTPVVVRNRDKRSSSISGTGVVYDVEAGGHSGQFPVTASHRRNTRKGSLLEISG